MKFAPTVEQIEENDRLREQIHREQERSMRDYKEVEKKADKAETMINDAIREMLLDVMIAVEERDEIIENLEHKIEVLTEEKEEAENRLEEIMEKKAYG